MDWKGLMEYWRQILDNGLNNEQSQFFNKDGGHRPRPDARGMFEWILIIFN